MRPNDCIEGHRFVRHMPVYFAIGILLLVSLLAMRIEKMMINAEGRIGTIEHALGIEDSHDDS